MTDNVLDLFGYIFVELFKELVFVVGKVSLLDYANLETYHLSDNNQRVVAALRPSMKEDGIATIQVADNQKTTPINVTVLTHKSLIPYRGSGLFSLIGPIDMDYHRSVSLVNVIGCVLAIELGDYYHYFNSNHYEVS